MPSEMIWLSPNDFVTGDPSLSLIYPSVAHAGVHVRASAVGDLKWISLGLRVPTRHEVVAVSIGYRLSNARSFISQVRLVEMRTPERAVVRHDDGTDLLSTEPATYRSELTGGYRPDGAVSLHLRLRFQDTADVISLGAVGLEVRELETGACLSVPAYTRETLPPAGRAGCLARLTDGTRGLWMDQGRQWFSLSGEVANVKEFGAFGAETRDADQADAVDDAPAFVEALAALSPGGTLLIPPGTYVLKADLVPDKPVIIQGAGMSVSQLRFSSGKGLRLRHRFEVGGGSAAAERSCVRDLLILCKRVSFPEWRPETAYAVGAQVRSRLVPLATEKSADGWYLPWQEDAGVHFVCQTPGTSGSGRDYQPGWDSTPGAEIPDGTCVWQPEDWSAITISDSWCTVERCTINEATDNGVFIRGTRGVSIADANVVRDCVIVAGDGHGIFLNGLDAQACTIQGNSIIGYGRGCAIYDSGFLANMHINNSAVACRRSYAGDGGSARSVWIGNYLEEAGPFRIEAPHEGDGSRAPWLRADPSPHIWISGQGTFDPPLAYAAPQTTCLYFDGQVWRNGLLVQSAEMPPMQRWLGGDFIDQFRRSGDTLSTTDVYVTDADDPGGYLSMLWGSRASEACRELTGEQSVWGPNRFRFPQGFYLGKNTAGLHQIWVTRHVRPPDQADRPWLGTLLWRTGDIVLNELAVVSAEGTTVLGWKAGRDGGWGGGRGYSTRTWERHLGPVHIGDGIEPSPESTSGHGKVYRVREFQKAIDGVWTRDNRLQVNLSGGMEPMWRPMGELTYEPLDEAHRIVWQCWGDVGMTWLELTVAASVVTR
jgi:hypothetical protein